MKSRPDRRARAPHDLHRKANPVLERAAPFVVAVVGLRRDELVDEVTLGAHDLDAVVAGALRERRTADERGDRPPDAPRAQAARAERTDRRPRRGRRDGKRVIGVAPRMQDLHRDPAALGVHGIGDELVPRDLPGERQLRSLGFEAADEVGRDAAGDHEAHAALRPRRVERRHPRVAVGRFLEARVHRAHQRAVLERREAEVERRQEVGVGGHGPHCSQCGRSAAGRSPARRRRSRSADGARRPGACPPPTRER